MSGVVDKTEGLVCGECGKVIDHQDDNFCSCCGNPLTTTAILLDNERKKGVKLQLLNELIGEISDKETLNKILLKINKFGD